MKPSFDTVILIPAYQPNQSLVEVVRGLVERGHAAIVAVDDGSAPQSQEHFHQIAAFPQVHIVRHAVNLGKGAALKTGLNYALVHFPSCCGIVTADADGQHHPDDILSVAEMLRKNPEKMVLGVRTFGDSVPLRSRLGNGVTRILMRLVAGQKLTDTQTGLRGIPVRLVPHLLRLPSSGYEFELDMLMISKQLSCPILEQPIRTIYLEGNQSSHFRPLLDSMRIYFLLFRFSLLALATAVLDNSIFVLAYPATGSIGRSQIAARSVAMVFNYLGGRRVVFHSEQPHRTVFPKYVALVIGSGLLSFVLIQFFRSRLGIAVVPAKIAAESLLFLLNFVIQRDFVFTKRAAPAAAD